MLRLAAIKITKLAGFGFVITAISHFVYIIINWYRTANSIAFGISHCSDCANNAIAIEFFTFVFMRMCLL